MSQQARPCDNHQFEDLGFQLACIDALLVLGKLNRELEDVLKIPHAVDSSEIVNQQRLKAFCQIPLTESRLEQIKSFAPDGGDGIYPYVMESWSGTQEDLYVKSFHDIKLLTNLEHLWVHAVVSQHALDLALLTSNKKLKEIDTDYFYLSRDIDIEKEVHALRQRGVTVRISGQA